MKKLQCEVCGSTEIRKTGPNIFQCQSCGTRYLGEEEIRVESAEAIENYITIAQNAYDSQNYQSAEVYCNKILERDYSDFSAWYLKGKAVGWQSTSTSYRYTETLLCFQEALRHYCGPDSVAFKEEMGAELIKICTASLNLACSKYRESCDGSYYQKLCDMTDYFHNKILPFLEQLTQCGGFMDDLAQILENTAITTWNHVILPEYTGSEGKPGKYEFERFLDRMPSCIGILQLSIDISSQSSQANFERYQEMSVLAEHLLTAKSWEKRYGKHGSYWAIACQISVAAKQKYSALLQECYSNMKELDPSRFTDFELELINQKIRSKRGPLLFIWFINAVILPIAWSFIQFCLSEGRDSSTLSIILVTPFILLLVGGSIKYTITFRNLSRIRKELRKRKYNEGKKSETNTASTVELKSADADEGEG